MDLLFKVVSFLSFHFCLQLMALINDLGPRLVDLSFRFVSFLSSPSSSKKTNASR